MDLKATSGARAPDQASSAPGFAEIDQTAINTIRTLTIDAVEKAASGHAGSPMGQAPVAYTLWTRFLRYAPAAPHWPNRDRFVLSAGHGSMLLYALLHLAGVARLDAAGRPTGQPAVSLDDIKAFRQLDSVCPGHPEYGHTTGVETTTGPLGQGAANSVGMAMGECWLAARFNRSGHTIFDYSVYAICSDGDLMEGISGEAASLAGHLKLSNLCWIYDDNNVSIEGGTELAFSEDVGTRFHGYGWAVEMVDDANDCAAFTRAVSAFKSRHDRPTLIRMKSVIGYGSPHRQGTAKIHSDPLGAEEVKLTKQAYGWPEEPPFLVPDGVRERVAATLGARGEQAYADWQAALDGYRQAFPELAAELDGLLAGRAPDGWDRDLPTFPADAKGIATREASGKALNAIAPRLPWLIGGSADLSPSTKTHLDFDGAGEFEAPNYGGRNLHFGVREHVMGAIANGLALSGLRPYTGTFLIFSDYMRPPTRLAALMKQPVVFVFSHDSIALGQDGPTHQPIEQLAALRAIPDMIVLRPADANETAEAWRTILAQTDRPACLVLSRQAVPTLDRTAYAPAAGLARGAYVLADSANGVPQVILMASGAEVGLCVAARETLEGEGLRVRVVSMPSWDLFEAQPPAYRDGVLPRAVTARVAVEAASPLGWDRYVGPDGEALAMHAFGASAPGGDLMRRFGFTADKVSEAARRQVGAARFRTDL
ncbi:transketolase [Phenylobacterium sp. LjRoot219]|uniref:transketolase n=1 Tax=Phenylobacterium sp. LjRoot219 TaxID=3342283 RepID=UPI003ECE4248